VACRRNIPGAGRLAGHLGLSNLIMFYDSNEIQLSTVTKAVTSEDTAKKYDAWGWRVFSIDGNDHGQIRDALKKANAEKEKPVIIIGRTIMGKAPSRKIFHALSVSRRLTAASVKSLFVCETVETSAETLRILSRFSPT